MTKKKEKSLEEIAESVRKGITFPEFETLKDFEIKVLKIARKYDPDATTYHAPHKEGITIIVNERQITICERRRGHEKVISKGVLEEAITKISNATDIPYNQLKLYFLGRGKQYKRYKRRFEGEYDL